MIIRQFVLLLIIAILVSFGANLLSSHRIDFIGKYRDLSDSEGPIVPPTAEPGDPPFIDVNLAQFEFENGNALFVDARDESEFECGTIPGSINIPFEYLPEGDLAEYFNEKLGGVSKDKSIIVFCSGEECDLSLHLARNMQDLGYTNVAIFFGGSREWEKFGLKMEKRVDCENS